MNDLSLGRTIYSAAEGWLVPESQRPANWRERTVPQEWPEEKPKEQWTGYAIRMASPSAPPKRAPPRASNGSKRGEKIRRRLDTARVMEMFNAGVRPKQIAFTLGCSLSPVNKAIHRATGKARTPHEWREKREAK